MPNISPITPLVIGVVADTHVPDRSERLHPHLLALFTAARVALILHAGDISTPTVLEELSQVAPVTAVKGNRDFAFPNLPLFQKIALAGVPLVLTHGHGGLAGYIYTKIEYLRQGYAFERYHKRLRSRFPDARVIVFGHTHRIENRVEGGCLFFNPGAAYACLENDRRARAGLLMIYPDQRVIGKVIDLDNEV
jgi:putative phosphoesterase